METKSLYFVGLSKNCFNTLKKNLDFLKEFKAYSKYKISIFIIDSDSDDGTKEFCRQMEQDKTIDEFIEIDNLSDKYQSRIKKLVYCRNKGLEQVKKNFKESSLFIPMDMDMDLFKLMDNKKFNNLLEYFINNEIDALFPFSIPYYYDIFALRKKGWVNGNDVNKADVLKKTLILGSFFINYFFIIRKQYSPNNFRNDLIDVESAFGGMAMYKITKSEMLDNTYKWDQENSRKVCEHIFFNELFNKKFILKSWNIETPREHNNFKSLNPSEKVLYFLSTIKYDLKHLKYKILGLKKNGNI
tara:strand:- start:246 stop:1145 length:900 start_codon:yes stop_codon:yes gene_type:complete